MKMNYVRIEQRDENIFWLFSLVTKWCSDKYAQYAIMTALTQRLAMCLVSTYTKSPTLPGAM